MRILRLLACICLLLLGTAAASADRVPPVMRLGEDVRPLAYALDLEIDPAREDFGGQADIDVELRRPLDFFWINGSGLEVRSAVLTAGGRSFAATAVNAGEHFIGLQFAGPVPAGRARLSIAYTARISARETRGVFRQQDLGAWYAMTQFEPAHARRAFPGFDEPHWKTPYTVSLTVPRGQQAFANTPVASERELADGRRQVRFAPTLPLPSYLVAFAVGPFEVVDGGTAGANRTPLRYVVPKGRTTATRYAREATPALLEKLEAYFGSPYPFEKLDSLVIPVTSGFAAMENPGLITYASWVLLSAPQEENESFQQRYASIAAHELAHQWFGNLVTMKWWDDLWLNESFATWMARKVVQQFHPAWDPHIRREEERRWAMQTDRLSSARQIRQPVHDRDDLAGAFDGITYAKGAAVLTMVEAYLGETSFRDGVRRYLQAHRFGNAAAEDFFAALGQSDAAVVAGFSSFVAQPGVPVVDVALDCSGARPAVRLRQQRFAPLGTAQPQQWVLPLCLRAEGAQQPQCVMLREPQQTVPLAGAARCPAWVLPNPGGTGYLLSRVDAPMAAALASARLEEQEAVALLGEQALLAKSGAVPASRLLQFAGAAARDPRPAVAAAAAAAVSELPLALFDAAARADLAAWVRAQFGPAAAALGWTPREGESDAVRNLRRAVLPLVAQVGEDAGLRAQAAVLASAWLAGGDRGLGAMRASILRTAAQDADGAMFDALVAAAARATDSRSRHDVYKALGRMRDPALLRRAFALALAPGAEVRETRAILESAGEDPANAPALFDFVRDQYDTLAARFPEQAVAHLPEWHTDLCTPQQRDAVGAFYSGAKVALPGAQRNLAQTLETVEICVRARALQQQAGRLLP